MRILNLIPHVAGGGAERQLGYVSGELARRGHDVAVMYLHFQRTSRTTIEGVELIPIHVSSPFDPRIVYGVLREVQRRRPDVLLSWSLPMDIVGSVVSRLTETPLLLREPTSADYYRDVPWKAALRMRALKGVLRGVIANSENGASYWRQRATAVPVQVIPNAIDLDAVVAAGDAGVRPRVLSVGRLLDMKNVDVLIRAVASARDLDLDVEILGEGVERNALEKLTARNGLADRVLFRGAVEDVWARLSGAAALVALSSFEGRPNTVLEAMASGVPLIVSDIPAHRELLDESSAIFVPVRDDAAVADALRETLRDREASRRRAAVARRMTEAWSIDAVTDAFERVLAAAAKETR